MKPAWSLDKLGDCLAIGDLPHLAINTTIRCQHRCEYCFEGDRTGYRDMPVDLVHEMLRSVVGRHAAVVFMGAEPTLNPDLIDLTRFACSLGLPVTYSTNGIRFQDIGFLRACLDAGLSNLEISFPYPDEETYARITRRPPSGFRRLLAAVENIERVNREFEKSGHFLLGININCVVSALNVDRLDEVIALLHERLAVTPFLLTFKRVNLRHMSPDLARPYWAPLARFRKAFMAMPVDMESAFGAAAVVFRDFPLCAIPGREERAVDVTTVLRGVQIEHNFGEQSKIDNMFPQRNNRVEHPCSWWCAVCTLGPICLFRGHFLTGDFGPDACPVPFCEPVPERLHARMEAADAMVGNAPSVDSIVADAFTPSKLAISVLRELIGVAEEAADSAPGGFRWEPLSETGRVELGPAGSRFRVRVGGSTYGLARWWAVRDDGLVGVRATESADPVDPDELEAFLRWILALGGSHGTVDDPWFQAGQFMTRALTTADPALNEKRASVWFRTRSSPSTRPWMEIHTEGLARPETTGFRIVPLDDEGGSGFLCGQVRLIPPADALLTEAGRRQLERVFHSVQALQMEGRLPAEWHVSNDFHQEAWRRFKGRLMSLGDSAVALTGGEVRPDRIVLTFRSSDGASVRACLKKGDSGRMAWSRDLEAG